MELRKLLNENENLKVEDISRIAYLRAEQLFGDKEVVDFLMERLRKEIGAKL